MNVYYVAGIPYSDELYHHGIKGQKWGIRRYMNPDGTLTEEGKRRYQYGDLRVGKYVSKNNSLLRRFATGDHVLGVKRYYDKKETKLQTKIQKRKAKGKDVSKLVQKYSNIKMSNIRRDINDSHVSTGKLLLQNALLGHKKGNLYRESRSLGYGRLKSLRRSSALKKYYRV